MKRFWSLLLCMALIIVALAGCGGTQSGTASNESQNSGNSFSGTQSPDPKPAEQIVIKISHQNAITQDRKSVV